VHICQLFCTQLTFPHTELISAQIYKYFCTMTLFLRRTTNICLFLCSTTNIFVHNIYFCAPTRKLWEYLPNQTAIPLHLSTFQVLVRTAAATKQGHEPPPASSPLQHLCTVPASRLDSWSPLTFFRQLTNTLILSAAQIPPKPVLFH